MVGRIVDWIVECYFISSFWAWLDKGKSPSFIWVDKENVCLSPLCLPNSVPTTKCEYVSRQW